MNFHDFKSSFQVAPVEEFPHQVTKAPLVSICVQAYNHENYISHCLDSILGQKTEFPFEILLSEDESSDGTRQICLEYAKRHPSKIRLFLHSRLNNVKVLKVPTGNFPILYNFFSTNGKYVAICEGDDYWGDPFKIQKQFDFMEENLRYSVCYHTYNIVDSYNQIIPASDKASPLEKDLSSEELIFSFIHPAPLTIFFRNIITKELPREIISVTAMDVFLCSLLGENGQGKYLKDIRPSFYRVHRQGMWSSMALIPKLYSKIHTYQRLSSYYHRIQNKEKVPVFKKKIFKIRRYILFLTIKNFQLKNFFFLLKNWRKLVS